MIKKQKSLNKSSKKNIILDIKEIIDFCWVGRRKYFMIVWINEKNQQIITWQPLSNLKEIKQDCQKYYNSLTEVQKKKIYNPNKKNKKNNISNISAEKGEKKSYLSQKQVTHGLQIAQVKQYSQIYLQDQQNIQRIQSNQMQIEQQQDPQLLNISVKIKLQNSIQRKIFQVSKARVNDSGKIEFLVQWEDQEGQENVYSILDRETVIKRWPEKLLEYYQRKVEWK